jgi:hypothetical protein
VYVDIENLLSSSIHNLCLYISINNRCIAFRGGSRRLILLPL